jgi:hypothetical protein
MFINDLKLEVQKRLLVDEKFVDNNLNVKVNKIEFLKSIDDTNYNKKRIILSSRLINHVKKAISTEFKDKSRTIISNRTEEALFFVSLIFNNFYFDELINFDVTFYKGVLIPKRIVEALIPVRAYYEIKKALEKHQIISEVQLTYEDSTISYSKDFKIAKQYVLNETYKHKIIPKRMKNKYISKFFLLKENGFLFGNRQDSLNNNYLPFNNDHKNLQYLYQKHMFFDDSFFKELRKNYPNFEEIIKDKNNENHFQVTKLLTFQKLLNHHVFTSTEAYGRIYLPFHYIPSEYRHCIRIGNNEKLFEVFDIQCCFVFLSASMIGQKTDDPDLKKECNKIISYTKTDIYNKILRYNNILCNKENRKLLKTSIMKWLFSTNQERHIMILDSKIIKYIDNYFKEKFPLFYKTVIFYENRIFYQINELNEVVKIRKSNLSYSCFEYESSLMFNNILPKLNETFKDIPFISLHDAVFIPERFRHLSDTIKQMILNMINEIE